MLTKILSVWSPLTSIVKISNIEQAKATLAFYVEDIGFSIQIPLQSKSGATNAYARHAASSWWPCRSYNLEPVLHTTGEIEVPVHACIAQEEHHQLLTSSDYVVKRRRKEREKEKD